MKTIVFSIICTATLVMLFSGKRPVYSFQPPSGYSGVNGFACNVCHSSYPLNSGGGGVVVNGLPLAGYNPGQVYPLSVAITHGASDRNRWGFEMKVVNGDNQPVGTFTSGPGSAVISDVSSGDFSEVAHSPAAIPGSAASGYTFTGISWQAPATPSPSDLNISFYVVGNAANFDGGTGNDYIYSNVYAGITLPVTLSAFSAAAEDDRRVLLQWQTASESNSSHFVIERSFDGMAFTGLSRVAAKGNATTPTHYQFTDAQPVQFNKPLQYRLNMVDRDGRSRYSEIKTVQLTGKKTVFKGLLPNPLPAGQPLAIEAVALGPGPAQLEVIDAAGSRVIQQAVTLSPGYNRIGIEKAPLLRPGTYPVVLRAAGFTLTQKLTVQ